jgi:hypothetical protein
LGVAALVANGGVALNYRFRGGDANMQSVWVCSRNANPGTKHSEIISIANQPHAIAD